MSEGHFERGAAWARGLAKEIEALDGAGSGFLPERDLPKCEDCGQQLFVWYGRFSDTWGLYHPRSRKCNDLDALARGKTELAAIAGYLEGLAVRRAGGGSGGQAAGS